MVMVKLEGVRFNFYLNPEYIESISTAEGWEKGLIIIRMVSGDEHRLNMSNFPGFSDINEFIEAVTFALYGEISEPNLTEIRREDEEEKG